MDDLQEKRCRCKLCGAIFKDSDMSEEHYPARSTGNDDIVALDVIKMFESLRSPKVHSEIEKRLAAGEKPEDITGNILDTQLTKSLYPKGRTARTLCRKCNTFLGKYDKSYLRFFDLDGNPKAIKGFQRQTKYQIIKAIYAKFISLPETQDEEFDFLDFIRNEDETSYNGTWKLYFVKRDKRSDLMGLPDIGTGKIVFDEGVVYEMSDDIILVANPEITALTDLYRLMKMIYVNNMTDKMYLIVNKVKNIDWAINLYREVKKVTAKFALDINLVLLGPVLFDEEKVMISVQ